MADEASAVTADEEVVVTPGAGEDDQNNDGGEQRQADETIESIASELGWVPQDQWRGEAEAWRPAADFIRAGRDINRSLSRDLRSMREQMDRLGGVTESIVADRVAQRDAYWAEQQRLAVEKGDHKAVEKAVEERAKLKTEAPPAPAGLPPETAEWTERHKAWFGKDPLATSRAKQIAEMLAKDGVQIDEQLRQVERAIKKEFPEHFGSAPKPPAATQTGGSRASGGSRGPKGYADMPPESQKLAQEYERRLGVKKEDFARSYWADQERKVG